MKKVISICIVLIFTVSGCTTFKIASLKVNDATATYYLPKKDLELGFNINFQTTQKIKVVNTIIITINKTSDSLVESTYEYIPEEEKYVQNSFKLSNIQLVGCILPDYTQGYKINTSSFSKSSGKRQQQTITFNEGSPTLASINGEAGTYTKEILQGIATGLQVIGKIVGAVFSAGTSITNLPATDKALKKKYSPRQNTIKTTRIYKNVYDSICTITYVKGFRKTIQAEDEKTTIVISETKPVQTLQLTAIKLTNNPPSSNFSNKDSLKIFYREPAVLRYQLENITQSETLFSETVKIPQLGTLKSIDTKVKGRNPYLAIDFDENGGLKKYEINTDRTPTDNAEMIQKLGENTKDLITDYRLQKIQNQFDYLKLMKDVEDLKKPAAPSK